MNQQEQLQSFFDEIVVYITTNKKSAWPYKHYNLLQTLVDVANQDNHKPLQILEAGTGLGLTAIAMSLVSKNVQIDTIDMDTSVMELAKNKAKEFGVDKQINFLNTNFLDITPSLAKNYDVVFFDGYALGLTVYLELERLLKPKGIMVAANLTLGGDYKKVILKLKDKQFFSSYFHFEDTGVGVKV